jgi:diaminohydroxyphosphoribosylaminopyrimidine deaminase/5-amino-6-(5-phosphoribosylamino)uracil reductase
MPFDDDLLSNLLAALYERKVSSLLVEGGAQLIQSFFDAGLWQEAVVYTGSREFENGLPAPHVPGVCVQTDQIGSDRVRRFVPHAC